MLSNPSREHHGTTTSSSSLSANPISSPAHPGEPVTVPTGVRLAREIAQLRGLSSTPPRTISVDESKPRARRAYRSVASPGCVTILPSAQPGSDLLQIFHANPGASPPSSPSDDQRQERPDPAGRVMLRVQHACPVVRFNCYTDRAGLRVRTSAAAVRGCELGRRTTLVDRYAVL